MKRTHCYHCGEKLNGEPLAHADCIEKNIEKEAYELARGLWLSMACPRQEVIRRAFHKLYNDFGKEDVEEKK